MIAGERKMKTILKGAASVILILLFFLLKPQTVFAVDNEYLVGIFGVPDDDWDILKQAGLNNVLVRQGDVEKTRNLPLKKIYVMGITPPKIKSGITDAEINNLFRGFNELKDAYGYYLGDDINNSRANEIDRVKKLTGLEADVKPYPLVGLISLHEWKGKLNKVDRFKDYHVCTYYYPLMRCSELSLPEMVKMQVSVQTSMRKYGRKTFVFAQTHPQFWYKEIIKLGNINKNALLYPDGQVARMLIYYAIATGSNGYFIYDWKSMSGESSKERLFAAAQAITETRPLYQNLSHSQGVEFFQRTNNIYGTIVKGTLYDIIFVFNSDIKTHYHPTVKSIQVGLQDVINMKKYKSVYKYSPLGITQAGDMVDVPQDHALILIAFENKDKANTEISKLNTANLDLYLKILQSRAEKLSQNIAKFGIAVPPLKVVSGDLRGKINSVLQYIDNLNEVKRHVWMMKATKFPIDGDIINTMYWKKKLNKAVKGETFNFYYDENANE